MNWYLKVVRDNYANFKGRARRQEYWMFAFINLIIILILNTIDRVAFSADMAILSSIYGLAILIPGIAVAGSAAFARYRSQWLVGVIRLNSNCRYNYSNCDDVL